MLILTQKQLIQQYPQAFSALPEPYQNDSCLEFYFDGNDCNSNLCCAPTADQAYILGEWECVFNTVSLKWEQIN